MSAPRAVTSVAGRLAVLLCGLAAVSTGLALVLQDRGLDQDLRLAARDRLAVSAAAADRLLADHLANVAGRYVAISRTPELRANLATDHAPTLSFYASQLLRDQGATLLGFLGRSGELVTAAGDPRLIDPAVSRVRGEVAPAGAECVAARDAARSPAAAAWGPCGPPRRGAEGSLFASRDELYALVDVPLRSGGEVEGRLFAVEAVGPALLAGWSELSGADLRLVALGDAATGSPPPEDGPLDALVRELPGFELRATTTYEAERATIRRARANLVASGVLALFIALAASLLLARAFARPIRRIREATARLSEGDLESRVAVDRGDELGQLGEAFNELASRLTDSQERVRRAQRLARFGTWYYDFESQAFDGTSEFRRLFGFERPGPIPLETLLERVRLSERDALQVALATSERRSTPFRLDVRARGGRDGERVLQVRGHARNRTSARIEGSVQDVTQQRAAEAQIRYLSRHDSLTGLGNRDQLMDDLGRRTGERASSAPFALLLVGIGDLQSLTDTFGHRVSDRLLVEVADRLVEGAGAPSRGGEPSAELVARLGDERFAVLLEGVGDGAAASRAAEPILREVRRAYRAAGDEVTLRASAALALWPADGADAETLLRSAETALTRVQREEPGSTRLYDESMHADASRRIQIASRLRRAIASGALELHYQPRVDPRSGGLLGFEGLARWDDPVLGPVSPGEFIPIAETTGSIGALGDWCIETAARQLRAWRDSGHEGLALSVNLSRQQLRPELVERIVHCTQGLDPAGFELEVTESALIEEGDAAIETLTALRAHGFRTALDDFGTGYSSLSYLRGLPLDTVKVDRAFIRDIAEDADAAALTGSVLSMCRALGLHAVVEGVETKEQLEVLVELGYPEVQGFYFSRPLPAAETESYIAAAPALTST